MFARREQYIYGKFDIHRPAQWHKNFLTNVNTRRKVVPSVIAKGAWNQKSNEIIYDWLSRQRYDLKLRNVSGFSSYKNTCSHKFIFNNSMYSCTGDFSEWRKCHNHVKQPKRITTQISKEKFREKLKRVSKKMLRSKYHFQWILLLKMDFDFANFIFGMHLGHASIVRSRHCII